MLNNTTAGPSPFEEPVVRLQRCTAPITFTSKSDKNWSFFNPRSGFSLRCLGNTPGRRAVRSTRTNRKVRHRIEHQALVPLVGAAFVAPLFDTPITRCPAASSASQRRTDATAVPHHGHGPHDAWFWSSPMRASTFDLSDQGVRLGAVHRLIFGRGPASPHAPSGACPAGSS